MPEWRKIRRPKTWRTITSKQRREAIKSRLRFPRDGWRYDPTKDPLRA